MKNSNNKRILLLCWFEMEGRPELLTPFLQLEDDFKIVHLYYRTREERLNEISPFPMIYWFDYSNAYQLLNDVKPDVVLGNTESLLLISLLQVCRKKHVPFLGLQHGFAPANLLDTLVPSTRTTEVSGGVIKKYLKIFKFYFSSFDALSLKKNLQALKVFYDFFKHNCVLAVKKNKYTWMAPDYYICFSEYSSAHYREIYKLNDNQLLYTGVICFDDLFKTSQKQSDVEEKYYLLIDTNFEEYKTPVSKDIINRCYYELLKYCRSKGAKLKIKLHPWSYKYTDLPEEPDIEFIKQVESTLLNKLILNSEGCFGFYSTLSFAVIAVKKMIQISYDDIYIKELVQSGISPVVDFFTFTSQDLDFSTNNPSLEKKITYLLYKTDGNAVERLRRILLNTKV